VTDRPPAGSPTPRRRLTAVCAALLGGAAALEGAARLAWFTAGVDAVGRGTVPVTATGADLVPALTGVALLAVAAVAAAVALAGAARRLLGVVVAAAGAWIGVVVGGLLLAPPAPADLAALPGAPAGGTAVADSLALRPGPLPALLGVLLLVAAGIMLAAGERRLPRLGARYAARPAGRAVAGPAETAGVRADSDPDRAAWDALDAGRDPTTDGPAADELRRPTRTDDGASGRAV
jgi:uncharacterized membrane protein (TIGR02234 family)